MRFDEGQHRAARHLRQAVATAATDTVFAVGEQDLILLDGDPPGGPIDLIADAVGDVVALIASLLHGSHFVGIQALVVRMDNRVGFHLLPHLFGRVDSARDDGISIAGPLNIQLRQRQGWFGGRFLIRRTRCGGPAFLNLFASGEANQQQAS